MGKVATSDARADLAAAVPHAAGITQPSQRDRRGVFVTDVIVELGFADPGAVQRAIEAARQSAKTPERCLLDTGVIDEQQFSLALAECNGLDHVNLDLFEVDPEAVGLIDKSTAARYTALPIAFATDGALIVAFDDPYDMLGITDIEVMAKSEVRAVVAAKTQIQRLIEHLPAPPEAEVAEEWGPTPGPEPDPTPGFAAEPAPAPAPLSSDDPRELSATLVGLQDRARHAISLVEGIERRIEELDEVDARAQQAASTLADERAQFEQERRQGAEREQELRQELAGALDKIAALEQRLSEVGAATELARTAIERLASAIGP